jgi:DNA-binding response OmpR family regulator
VIRVLIAEDEFLVGIQLEEELRAAGCAIVGPFSTLETATLAARRERFDLALLDINLNGIPVYPLADELHALGTPFIFVSGYLSAALPKRFRESPQIAKPHDPAALIRAIRAAVSQAE